MSLCRCVLFVVLALGFAIPVCAVHPGTDVIVAAAGSAHGAGSSYWLSDLVIFNPGDEAATVTLSYLPRNSDNSNPATVDLTVGPGETLLRPNVVSEEFGEQSFGALRIVSDQAVVVTSLVKNNPEGPDASDEDAFGQGFPGIPVANAVAAGESTQIAGLAEGAAQRSNFGAVDVSGDGSEIRVRVIDPAGVVLGENTYTTEPWAPFQKNITDIVPAGFAAGTLDVEVISGAVVAYGSKVNNGSGDASTLEMYWSCKGGRSEVDGTYYFVSYDLDGGRTGGGSMTVANGQVVELCGNLLALDKDPACSYWLPYCTEETIPLADFTGGEQMEVTYSSGGTSLGAITWTMTLAVSDNLSVSGTLEGVGSGWSGGSAGCNGDFPEMTLFGGVH